MPITVEDLDVGVSYDITRSDVARARNVDYDSLGSVAEQLSSYPLDVYNDFGDVFFDTGDSGYLMKNTVYLNVGDCNSGKRAE